MEDSDRTVAIFVVVGGDVSRVVDLDDPTAGELEREALCRRLCLQVANLSDDNHRMISAIASTLRIRQRLGSSMASRDDLCFPVAVDQIFGAP